MSNEDDGLHMPEATGGVLLSNGPGSSIAINAMSFFETSKFIANTVADLIPTGLGDNSDVEAEGEELLQDDNIIPSITENGSKSNFSTLADVRPDPRDAEANAQAVALTIISRAEFLDAGLAGYGITGEHTRGVDPFFRWSLASTDSGASKKSKSSAFSIFGFNPPPQGLKITGNPRKDYEAAMSSILWGFYASAYETLIHLASIGFIPAKEYLHPTTSTLRNPTEASFLANLLLDRGEEEVGMLWLKMGAEGGSGSATLQYGKRLAPSDPGEAMVWLHRSWEMTGDAEAAFLIGCVFSNGGVPKRTRRASKIDDADEDEDEEEEEEINEGRDIVPWGVIDPSLASGKTVLRDPHLATEWWHRGVEKVHHRCMAAYAESKLAGLDGLPPNPERSVLVLTQAASKVPRAAFILGHCYRHGLGCKRNDDAAATWLRKAAAQGFGDEHMHASSSYEDMEAVGARAIQGVRFLRRAADAGVPRAMYVLGMCLQRGFGTPRDPEEARVWLGRAEEVGYVPSVADPKVERVEVFEAELEGPVRVGMGTTAKAELLKAVAAEALAATGGSALGVSVAPLVEVRKEEKGVEAAAVEDGSSLMDMEREGVEPVAETLPDPLVDVQQENSLIPSVSANKESATPQSPNGVDILGLGDASPSTIATPQLPQANLYPYPFFSAPIDIVEVFAPQKEDDDELYHFTLVPPAL